MITALFSLLLAGQAVPTLDLKPVPTGAMPKVGFYYPQRLQLTAAAPSNFKNVPAGALGFGSLRFGGKLLPVVETGSATSFDKLYVDTSGTGDFALATAFSWTGGPQNPRQPNGPKLYRSAVLLPSPIGQGRPVSLSFYRFDPADTARAALSSTLLYFADYALDGQIKLGGQTYHAMLLDAAAAGDFDSPSQAGRKGDGSGGVIPNTKLLLIDRNGDGRFSQPYEIFDATEPFNIGGVSYQLTGVSGSGANAGVAISSRAVAEIPVPPSLAPNTRVLAFTATDVNGKTVHFPQDFKGKVVMLDFWATWCGPCMGEVPNVVKVYNDLHGKGFEILGISLDNATSIKQLGPVTRDKGMTWDQVADGKYWDAAVAKLYGIQSIPAAFIVDGDTGKILAEGESIRGDRLLPAVQSALSSRTPK